MKEIRNLPVALATGRHPAQPPSDTYRNFSPSSSRKTFSISPPYILPLPLTPISPPRVMSERGD
jgi:hypothetical protein